MSDARRHAAILQRLLAERSGYATEIDGAGRRRPSKIAAPGGRRLDPRSQAGRPTASPTPINWSKWKDFQPISPDVAVCNDCLREMLDPADRRFRYPFINCTNCGPRFTIIKDIPYDRPATTMASFVMCPDCAREYADPSDRRFHAQPVACPVCGPAVWLETVGQVAPTGTRIAAGPAAIGEARRLLAGGKILAVKGLGGFHLACDATNAAAVAELRRRKLRVDKPFAVMFPDSEAVREHCDVAPGELGAARIDCQADRLAPSQVVQLIARERLREQHWLGTILPYTPLHHLLLEREAGFPGRAGDDQRQSQRRTYRCGERQKLVSGSRGLADAFLMHDRDI